MENTILLRKFPLFRMDTSRGPGSTLDSKFVQQLLCLLTKFTFLALKSFVTFADIFVNQVNTHAAVTIDPNTVVIVWKIDGTPNSLFSPLHCCAWRRQRKNWTQLAQRKLLLSILNVSPISQYFPENPLLHSHRNPFVRSSQVPLLHDTSSQSSTSERNSKCMPQGFPSHNFCLCAFSTFDQQLVFWSFLSFSARLLFLSLSYSFHTRCQWSRCHTCRRSHSPNPHSFRSHRSRSSSHQCLKGRTPICIGPYISVRNKEIEGWKFSSGLRIVRECENYLLHIFCSNWP